MSELPQTVSQVLDDYLRSASTAGIIVEDQDPDWAVPVRVATMPLSMPR